MKKKGAEGIAAEDPLAKMANMAQELCKLREMLNLYHFRFKHLKYADYLKMPDRKWGKP